MRLEFSENRFVLASSFEERAAPKVAGFRWDPTAKQWWTHDPMTAQKIERQFWAPEAAAEIESKMAAINETIEASAATDSDLEIPSPDGLDYLPYQRAGIAFASRRPGVLIGDEMGLGKTIQAIGIANADPTLKKILIICPASLKINWRREWTKWDVHHRTVGIANGIFPQTAVVIINFDVLKKWREQIESTPWDLLVVDECHFLKNPKAQRTKMVMGGGKGEAKVDGIKARRRVFLTGTPILNRPIELWTLVHSLDPQGLGASWQRFTRTYCDAQHTRFGIDVSGASNLEDLQARLRASIMVRRLKKDVLTELPPKVRQLIAIEPDGAAKAAVEAEKRSFEAAKERVIAAKHAAEMAKASDNDEEYKKAVENLREAGRFAFEEIARERHLVALAKVPQFIAHVREVLEDEGKVVLFAHHKDVIAAIQGAFPGSVRVVGDDEQESRQAAVDAFQNDPACKVFVGSIRAAGVGLTLTAASRVIFAELDWTPGSMSQAEDRCHRIGQTDSVLVQHVVLDGSLDQRIAEMLVRKQAIIEAALDGGGEIDDEPIIASLSEQETPATQTLSRKKIEEEALNITAEEIQEVHAKLKLIAGFDVDHAQSVNGVGFNKIDTGIGHSLADCHSLTAKQAVLGRKILKKYHRQLGEVANG